MRLGIFAKTFVRPTLEAVLDAVKGYGLDVVQFNMSCAGLASMPDAIEDALAERIRLALEVRGIHLAAVSGTFNMIHPDPARRELGVQRLNVLAGACRAMGAGIITLCTGTRDPDDMWRRHPDNDSAEAWRDLLQTMEAALEIADLHGVTLAFEPEVSNVVDSALKARRLLTELHSSRLKVVMDPANLFHAGELPRMREVLAEAFDVLGDQVVIAHAKDLTRDGQAGREPAGSGRLDYDLYLRLLRQHRFDGSLIMHGLEETQVPASAAFLRARLAAAGD